MSKYSPKLYIEFFEDQQMFDLYSSKSQKFVNSLKKIESSDKFQVGSTNSLDSISYSYYGTEELWWVIALYNDIVNPFEIAELLYVNIPNRISLEELFLTYQEA